MMAAEPQALCVVNTKKAAKAVYDELAKLAPAGLFHLSTAMCPQHRREKLAQVRGLLAAGAPCRVVSTQLIEAGVDVDFPFLMREMGPLEAVIQAAGRCNREGRLGAGGGRVVVFRSEEGGLPQCGWYDLGREKVEAVIKAKGDGPQIDDPAAIRDYYDRLFRGGDLDKQRVQQLRGKFQFQQTADAYRLIDNAGQPAVVRTWEPYTAEIEALLVELAVNPRKKSVYRRLAAFQVNLLSSQLKGSEHLYHERLPGVMVWDGKYDDKVGIVSEMADIPAV
jgi:CRISPR-associated endonuclease/helicase Cas3